MIPLLLRIAGLIFVAYEASACTPSEEGGAAPEGEAGRPILSDASSDLLTDRYILVDRTSPPDQQDAGSEVLDQGINIRQDAPAFLDTARDIFLDIGLDTGFDTMPDAGLDLAPDILQDIAPDIAPDIAIDASSTDTADVTRSRIRDLGTAPCPALQLAVSGQVLYGLCERSWFSIDLGAVSPSFHQTTVSSLPTGETFRQITPLSNSRISGSNIALFTPNFFTAVNGRETSDSISPTFNSYPPQHQLTGNTVLGNNGLLAMATQFSGPVSGGEFLLYAINTSGNFSDTTTHRDVATLHPNPTALWMRDDGLLVIANRGDDSTNASIQSFQISTSVTRRGSVVLTDFKPSQNSDMAVLTDSNQAALVGLRSLSNTIALVTYLGGTTTQFITPSFSPQRIALWGTNYVFSDDHGQIHLMNAAGTWGEIISVGASIRAMTANPSGTFMIATTDHLYQINP